MGTEERHRFHTEVAPVKNKCYISGKGIQVSCAPSLLSSFKRIVSSLAKSHCNMYRCCPHCCIYRCVLHRTVACEAQSKAQNSRMHSIVLHSQIWLEQNSRIFSTVKCTAIAREYR